MVTKCHNTNFTKFKSLSLLISAPSAVEDLKGNFTDKTVPYINWTAPETSNGPLDGYLLTLRDLTNTSVNINELLPANQTSYVYAATQEFEK